ncbi:hypothetical protein BDZ85DRAFT_68401 [Elsinoe ampelina]|uniref:Cyclin-D1-binding protein 1-like N-terminal domain-containing protein n=1 Tax=Elsinoe ampelina TaxID=302913 RepID=A0A6A6GIK5_9PEZI|nr:hypothetical protein BDZ85DRAFT_68401 [Elsinoe ampelina]
MAPSPSKPDLLALQDLTNTSLLLLTQYLTTLTTPSAPTSSSIPDPPNPLQVLRDSALLLKSHTTKLSLLLLNAPFTPSAVTKVLREITGTCLPAMMSAVELADPDVWGRLLRGEIVARVARVIWEMKVCLEEVKGVALDSEGAEKREGNKRDTLSSTGVVWEACDAVVELEGLDVGGVALKRAKEWQALVKDAIEELREWGENEEEDDEDEGDDGEEEDIFGAGSLPRDRVELRELLAEGLGKVRKVEILYTALIKRRVKTFTKEKARIKPHVLVMDDLMDHLKQLPELVDELASGFYDLDEEAVKGQIKAVVDEAKATITLVKKDWQGKEDEFTTWSTKWLEVVK